MSATTIPPKSSPAPSSDPSATPEFAALRELRQRLSRGGLPAERTPTDDARLTAFMTIKELLRIVDVFRRCLQQGEALRLRHIEHESSSQRVLIEIVIEKA
ncbi:MAG: hypothetical protein U0441_20285 [Polyangiaceae bacterium]